MSARVLEKEVNHLKERLSTLETEKLELQQKLDLYTATWQTELETQWAQARARLFSLTVVVPARVLELPVKGLVLISRETEYF